MLLQDSIGGSFHDAFLRAVPETLPASDAGIINIISFFTYLSGADGITFPKDRVDAQIEIFNDGVLNAEYNTDFPCIFRIDIGEIRLFLEDDIDPLFLLAVKKYMASGS